MKPGARLVIVDRSVPDPTGPSSARDADRHEVQLAVVEGETLRHGFETLAHDNRFIDRPDDDTWWMIVARKPLARVLQSARDSSLNF